MVSRQIHVAGVHCVIPSCRLLHLALGLVAGILRQHVERQRRHNMRLDLWSDWSDNSLARSYNCVVILTEHRVVEPMKLYVFGAEHRASNALLGFREFGFELVLAWGVESVGLIEVELVGRFPHIVDLHLDLDVVHFGTGLTLPTTNGFPH